MKVYVLVESGRVSPVAVFSSSAVPLDFLPLDAVEDAHIQNFRAMHPTKDIPGRWYSHMCSSFFTLYGYELLEGDGP